MLLALGYIAQDESSDIYVIISDSSFGAPGPAVPLGQKACGKLKSPPIIIVGVGFGSSLRHLRSLVIPCDSSGSLDGQPCMVSSVCQYTALKSRCSALIYTHRISNVPFENLRAVSAEAAISSQMYIAAHPVSRPRRFLGRLQSERKIVYPGIFISASRWSRSHVSVIIPKRRFFCWRMSCIWGTLVGTVRGISPRIFTRLKWHPTLSAWIQKSSKGYSASHLLHLVVGKHTLELEVVRLNYILVNSRRYAVRQAVYRMGAW